MTIVAARTGRRQRRVCAQAAAGLLVRIIIVEGGAADAADRIAVRRISAWCVVGGLCCCGCHRGRRNRLLQRCTYAVLGDRHLDAVAYGAQPNVAGLGNRPVRKEARWSNGLFMKHTED